ncbi:MAG: hypothetical protein A3J50_03655 [Candidatus Woykebacteria bacterium RIFCSPHIGHO2_02_FULL_43_16b]|uniref:Uncharacterized protein n=1 Tax=Candidatus Woykebacteria bacterium RIFCSPHIGHO2_02_FULL_43_16b TaxID=1802601 RepID=A0A1G1WNL0_9BACT|nr:MAG: hypothetical protein A3J50_03655 [Candidatus Woykebacteria bacterium RIFCSPHIGHO2_02_FULL_43_16b]
MSVQPITDEELIAFLIEERAQGYASGRDKQPGLFPGSKTFGVYVSESGRLSALDTYWGRKLAAGFYLICTEQIEQPVGQPYMLIQYGGGCRVTLSQNFVGEVNSFLQRALKALVRTARLPSDKEFVSYTEDDCPFIYFGKGYGDVSNLEWTEVIVRKDTLLNERWFSLFNLVEGSDVVFNIWSLFGVCVPENTDVLFYHVVKHFLLR